MSRCGVENPILLTLQPQSGPEGGSHRETHPAGQHCLRLTWGANPCISWLAVLLSGLEDEAQAYGEVTTPKAERAGKERRG